MKDSIVTCLEDAKAEDISIIDLQGKTQIADHMIVASGRSHRHVSAIADQVLRQLKEDGFGSPRIEGLPHCDWVLVDAGDVVVHIFRPEVREFYNLEKLWSANLPSEKLAI
jgi:ribosome-associated protein